MNDTRPDRTTGGVPKVGNQLNKQVRKDTAALGESEKSYRAIVEAAPVAVTTVRDGLFITANPAAYRTLGFSDPTELVGMPVMSFVARESQ